ncbi:MAG TPA: ABC transporter ATP-binding protein [Stellaceae bacterium]|nr:ABC transporter ATP-binding protein [Stellaceae bacterium]
MAALGDFSLDVRDGELVAILGPSGCGKSTLLRCVAGLERPDLGEISIDGTIVASPARWVPPERRQLGMVFQSYALWPHLTVAENLAFPLRMLGRRKDDIADRIGAALNSVGLSGKEHRLPSQLSGGQQQRVALARAIISNPRLLLFDEPLSNLDVNLREAMRIELRALKQALGWTGLYVTHDRSEAVHLADRIVVLRGGAIQQIGTGSELYERPANLFVAEFVGELSAIPARSPLLAGFFARRPAPARGEIVAFRPEAISLSRPAPGAAAQGAWRGRIKLATNLGWYTEYVLEIDSIEFKVRAAAGPLYRLGEELAVSADFSRAMRFTEDRTPL